jgi:pimeloyl-ACP methyl ester carboxylesterase
MNEYRAPGLHTVRVPDTLDEPREYLLFVPSGNVRGLVVIFHPFGSRPELVVHGGTDGDYLIRPLTGAASSAQALGLAVLAPRSRGRRLAGVSLAWKSHLDAVWKLSESLRKEFGLPGIGVGGLSMGGLEALVFAGQHPEGVLAVWAASPIVDLAQWCRDLTGLDSPDGKPRLADLIGTEVGGTPDELPREYWARSPFDYVESLARVRVLISWSPVDTVIPNQRTAHSHLLAARLRERGGDVVEDVVTHSPADGSADSGRFAHEACDVREAMGWLAEVITAADSIEVTTRAATAVRITLDGAAVKNS